MSDLAATRAELRGTEQAVADALRELRRQIAGLGPTDAAVLASEVAAIRRDPSRAMEDGDWADQLERVRTAVRGASDEARHARRRRAEARRAAWAQAIGDAGGLTELLPAPEPDPRAPAGRLLRHGWLAGLAVGGLLMADGVATLVWQEPLSALHASAEQDRLDRQLPGLVGEFERIGRGRAPDFAADARRLAAAVAPGRALGRIELPSLGTGFVVVQGTGTQSLEAGPGHYATTALPGEDGTVGIAGHRTTYLAPFRGLDRLGRGERVVLEMPYGRFTYRVTRRALVDPSSSGVLRSTAGDERLVLTTCDPVFSDARRLVISARLVDARR